MAEAEKVARRVHELRPPRWLVGVSVLSFGFFTTLAAVTLVYAKDFLTGTVLAAMAALALGGILESLISRIEVCPEAISIRGLFSREEILTTEIVEVLREKSSLSLRLKSGGWKSLPGWIDTEEARIAISGVLASSQSGTGLPCESGKISGEA